MRLSRGPVEQGQGCSIDSEVTFGEGVVLGHRVIINGPVTVGSHVVVGDGSIIGRMPSRSATSTLQETELPPVLVGNHSIIGAYAIVYQGVEIGDNCFIADTAQIRERCTLGHHVVVGHNATIENDTVIGEYTKLQTGAYITAKSVIESYVFVAPMVKTSNDPYLARTEARHGAIKGPTIRRGARIGVGAVLLPRVEIGQEAVVAAGSVVTRNVAPYTVVMGVPARCVRKTPEEQILFPDEEGTSN